MTKTGFWAGILPPVGVRYVYFAVFAGGMTTLAAELSAERLLGPVFGTTNLVLAGIIGLILLYLTVGYFVGGAWADRTPSKARFFQIMIVAGFALGLIPAIARPVLQAAVAAVTAFNAPVAGGALLVVLAVFAVPVTLLGCLSPFAIRLVLTDSGQSGRIAGRVYAVSTLGSLIGTFLPALVLIPRLGTHYTYVALGVFLLGVGVGGLALVDRKQALLWAALLPLLVIIGWATGQGRIKPGANVLYEGESTYNYIQVVEVEGTRYLLLNEGQGLHSVYNPDNPATYGTWDFFSVGPFFNAPPVAPADVQRAGVIGLAAGTAIKQWTLIFGPIPMDGYEIDTQIVAVGREYFDMTEPHLTVIAGDGRFQLSQRAAVYDTLAVDAYRLPYIPWQLTTVEFFTLAKAHLNPEIGSIVINVGRTPSDRRLIDAMANTLLQVFPSVYVIDVPGSFNSIVVATVQPTEAGNLAANLALLDPASQPLLVDILTRAVANLTVPGESEVVFTDDHAPLEALTNSIVVNYFLGEGLPLLLPPLN